MLEGKIPLPAAAAESNDALYVDSWPGRPALYRLKDRVVLQVPPQFQMFWAQRHWLTGASLVDRPPRALDELPVAKNVQFALHLPTYEGYTPNNFRIDPHSDRISVFEVSAGNLDEMRPGAPGLYLPNVEARLFREPPSVNASSMRERHGLRCYDTAPDSRRWMCMGPRSGRDGEFIVLDVDDPGHPSAPRFPQMQALYFSPAYGGLHIGWRTHSRHFSDWKEIDDQVWTKIHSWNVAPSTEASSTLSR